ncbi:MAG: PQQ-dependent sugar dehydrogenase, partial [Glaciihabitans sp.]
MSRNTTIAALRAPALVGAALLVLTGCTAQSAGEPAPVPPATTSAPPAPAATDGPVDAPGSTPGATTTPDPSGVAATSTSGPVQPTGETRVIASGLRLPWSVVRLETGAVLVSERDTARVIEIVDGANRVVGEVPGVVPGGEGGLLGLAVLVEPGSAGAAGTTWLYAYTTAASDNRVIRMPLGGAPGSLTLGAAETVLTGIPKAGNHNGGRIKFGPDGMLYITAGDAGVRDRSQNT